MRAGKSQAVLFTIIKNLSFAKRKNQSSVTDLPPPLLPNSIPQCQNCSLFILIVSHGSIAIRLGVLPPVGFHRVSQEDGSAKLNVGSFLSHNALLFLEGEYYQI